MHPVIDILLPCGAFALGNFVFMVRKQKVFAAAVYIESLSKILHTHGRALNMPSGSAFSPGAVPCGLSGFLRLPQSEVFRSFLVGINIQSFTGSGFPVVCILARQFPIAGESGYAIINIT